MTGGLLDTTKQRASALIILLGAALAYALTPFLTGLMGILVLYVIFAPVHRWLIRRGFSAGVASGLVILLGILLILGPGVSLITVLIGQAQSIAANVVQNPILTKLSTLRVAGFDIGSQLAEIGGKVVQFVAGSAFGFLGTATRTVLNLIIAFFGLYYLLQAPDDAWQAVEKYIPFSSHNALKLRQRFHDVTVSTLIGTIMIAVIQGALVGLGFLLTGLPDPLFYGVLTTIFAVLPVLGSGMIWLPGAIALYLDHRPAPAVALAVGGVLIVGNIDSFLRPFISRRLGHIHPMITLIGVFAAVPQFGLLGLIVGPLAVSYFFEIIKMYGEEYLDAAPAMGDRARPEDRAAGEAAR